MDLQAVTGSIVSGGRKQQLQVPLCGQSLLRGQRPLPLPVPLCGDPEEVCSHRWRAAADMGQGRRRGREGWYAGDTARLCQSLPRSHEFQVVPAGGLVRPALLGLV